MKSRLKVVLVIAVFLGGFFLFQRNQVHEYHIDSKNPMYQYFVRERGEEVRYTSSGDIDNDGGQDLIILWYNRAEDQNFVSAVLNREEGYAIVDGTKGPFENLKVEFKEIDSKEPMEFIIYGSRNGNHGYLIYRLQEGRILNIFGEGAEDC